MRACMVFECVTSVHMALKQLGASANNVLSILTARHLGEANTNHHTAHILRAAKYTS